MFALPAIFAVAQAAEEKAALPFVAVTAIIRDASIDALYTGMTDALREAGYRDGDTVRLRFESANTDAVRAAELVRSFGRENADVIVAFTEPSARIAATERLRAPLVIAAIGPEAAEEIRRDRKARQLTGIVDAERYDTQLTLIREIAPKARTVAVPVGVDKPPDKEAMKLLRAFARSIDLTIEALPVSVENGIIAAKIEEYTPGDTVILLDTRIFPDAPVERIIAAAETTNLLVFASDEDAVVSGALAAIVPEPYGTGLQIGRLVARILKEPAAARRPMEAAEPSYIVINQDTASRIGTEIPDTVLVRRGRIIGWADVDGPRPRGKPVVPEPPLPAPEDTKEPETETANPRSTPPAQDR